MSKAGTKIASCPQKDPNPSLGTPVASGKEMEGLEDESRDELSNCEVLLRKLPLQPKSIRIESCVGGVDGVVVVIVDVRGVRHDTLFGVLAPHKILEGVEDLKL